ncbi:hypothetical protein PHJA_001586500 [Phtheirospermum japonicum]|uniref:GFO/IDH/MocA-like oxidoreductase domain-containing protein n=1 Tax=Phtheirospermum japonicum TaxID=374723 RepID=A0A830CJ36_9LAMI|nr:hypothetical protein PHJA_001586500 [Phtheirospermum japonicum]
MLKVPFTLKYISLFYDVENLDSLIEAQFEMMPEFQLKFKYQVRYIEMRRAQRLTPRVRKEARRYRVAAARHLKMRIMSNKAVLDGSQEFGIRKSPKELLLRCQSQEPSDFYESARGAVEIAKKLFPDVECKWGEEGLTEIIRDASIIGVAVVDMSLRLLKGGKHVLQAGSELEKALSCYNAINRAPIWAVAENYRFEPAFVEGRKLMAEIGDVINIHVIIEGSMNSSNPYYSSSWRRDFSGGFILDMGVHFISGLRMLAGCEITSVSAITSHVDSTLPPPDHISSTIQLENGSSGVFVMVVSSRSPKVLWRIVGLKGTLQVERGSKDGKHGYIVILFSADGQSKSWFYPFSGVTDELKTFLSDISLASLKNDGSHEVEPRLSFVEVESSKFLVKPNAKKVM